MAALAGRVAKKVFSTVEEELHDTRERLRFLEEKAKAFAEEKREIVRRFEEEKKQMIGSFIAAKIAAIFEYVMAVVLGIVKDAAKDPYMPHCIARMIDRVLDRVWPDVKLEVRDAIVAGIGPHKEIHHGEPMCMGRWNPVAFVCYHMFPYDRNLWHMIRDPVWVLLQVISVFPKWGVSYIFYFILFWCMDKRDTFQLLLFVLEFKFLLFLSLGIIGSIIGVIQYHICISAGNCEDFSPRDELYTLGLFILQVVLIWAAFALSICAHHKGGNFFRLTEASKEAELEAQQSTAERKKSGLHKVVLGDLQFRSAYAEQEDSDRGSRVMLGFLIYDLVAFGFCLLLVIIAAFANGLDTDAQVQDHPDHILGGNWKFSATIYCCKVLYGLLSFPFVLLKLPGAAPLLSHARPTGYNPWGRTVPYIGREEAVVPWLTAEENAARMAEVEERRQALWDACHEPQDGDGALAAEVAAAEDARKDEQQGQFDQQRMDAGRVHHMAQAQPQWGQQSPEEMQPLPASAPAVVVVEHSINHDPPVQQPEPVPHQPEPVSPPPPPPPPPTYAAAPPPSYAPAPR